jgi:peptidoglycan/LPS O-acetylase OafA/YrhL
VVAINRNARSQSVGTAGRNNPVRAPMRLSDGDTSIILSVGAEGCKYLGIVRTSRNESSVNFQKMKYRADIDGLRAIAVLSVIAFHFNILVPHFWVRSAPGGFVGVDVFFVISGYLITQNIYDDINHRTYAITEFYNRRIRRIFPALFVVFAFCIAATFFLNFPAETAVMGMSIIGSIFFVSNVLFYDTPDTSTIPQK